MADAPSCRVTATSSPNLQSSRPPAHHYPLFEGWTGAGMLVAVYVAAEFFAYSLGGSAAALYVFLAWNLAAGPLLTVLITVMTLRASVLPDTSVWRRLVILSSLAVP